MIFIRNFLIAVFVTGEASLSPIGIATLKKPVYHLKRARASHIQSILCHFIQKIKLFNELELNSSVIYTVVLSHELEHEGNAFTRDRTHLVMQ